MRNQQMMPEPSHSHHAPLEIGSAAGAAGPSLRVLVFFFGFLAACSAGKQEVPLEEVVAGDVGPPGPVCGPVQDVNGESNGVEVHAPDDILDFLASEDTQSVCLPNCQMMECGSDGCGGSCGDCEPGHLCAMGHCLPCEGNCAGQLCTDEPCAATCDGCFDPGKCDMESPSPECCGFLSLAQIQFAAASGSLTGIKGATLAHVSSDGQRVVLASEVEGSVSVLERDPASGQLTQLAYYLDSQKGANAVAGVSDIGFSPDSSLVYLAGDGDCMISTMAVNYELGTIEQAQCFPAHPESSFGLTDELSLDVYDPAGDVYLKGYMWLPDDASGTAQKVWGILQFRLDKGAGVLRQQGFSTAPKGSCDGPLALTPDGLFAYCIELEDGPIMNSWSRDPTHGHLTAIAETDLESEVLTPVIVTADGKHVVFGRHDGCQYSDYYECPKSPLKITFLERKNWSGELAIVQEVGCPDLAPYKGAHSKMVAPADGRGLYWTWELGWNYAPDKRLLAVRYPQEGGPWVCEPSVSLPLPQSYPASAMGFDVAPDGGHLYLLRDAALDIYPLSASGGLGEPELLEEGDSPPALQAVEHAIFDPSGHHLYTAAAGQDAIGLFVLNEEEHTLGQEAIFSAQDGGILGLVGVNRLALSPGGDTLYALSQDQHGEIVLLGRDAETGTLSGPKQLLKGGAGGLYQPTGLAVDPVGGWVVVSGVGESEKSTLASYLVTPEGILVPGAGVDVSVYPNQLLPTISVHEDLLASSEGKFLFVRGTITYPSGDDWTKKRGLHMFVVGANGLLTPTGFEAHLNHSGMVMTPDGRILLIGDEGLLQYTVDKEAHILDLVHYGSMDSENLPQWVDDRGTVLTPDGQDLYLANLARYRRDPDTGTFSFVHKLKHGAGSIYGLNNPTFLVAPPTASHLVLFGGVHDSMGVLVRNLCDVPGETQE